MKSIHRAVAKLKFKHFLPCLPLATDLNSLAQIPAQKHWFNNFTDTKLLR